MAILALKPFDHREQKPECRAELKKLPILWIFFHSQETTHEHVDPR